MNPSYVTTGEVPDTIKTFKLITLNVDGVTSKENYIFSVFENSKADIIFLTEAHNITQNFLNLIAIKNYTIFSNPTFQNAWNGTAIIIKDSFIENTEISHNIIIPGRVQKIKFKINSIFHHFYCIYLTSGILASNIGERTQQLNILFSDINLLNLVTDKLVLAGDFNFVEAPIDTVNPQNFRRSSDVTTFLNFKQQYAILDPFRIKFPHKNQYTRIQGDTARRLDRIYISDNFHTSHITSSFIDLFFSDHCFAPMLTFDQQRFAKWGKGRWKLNESLLTKENRKEFEYLWSEWQKMKVLFPDTLSWWDAGKKKVKSFFIQKGVAKRKQQRNKSAELSSELNNIHSQIHLSTQQKKDRIAQIKYQLKELANYKTTGQKIRSRIIQFSKEEENRTDFYKLETQNAESKQITVLEENGQNITEKNRVMNTVYNFWNNLWGKKKNIDLNKQKSYLQRHFQNNIIDLSLDNFTIDKKEIKEGLAAQNKNGTPGSDGFTPAYYTWAWEIIGDDMCELLNNCYLQGKMSDSMSTALVTILPKKGNLKLLKNWRPISLLNVDYKILSKIITKRLQEEVKDKISLQQKCALKDRQISDIHLNLLAALKRSQKSRNPIIITCYDYKKAFDMIDHSVIWETLESMHVKPSTIRWVQTMYSNIISKIQINGAMTLDILILRGIRQGCPLSMLLFIIALESLTRSLQTNQFIESPFEELKAQQFADDLTSITSNAHSQFQVQKEINLFCEISGLELNHSKTYILPMNLHQDELRQLRRQNPFAEIKEEIKILGIYFNIRETISNLNWEKKISNIDKILHIHSKRDLTIFGKTKIINTLALSHINMIAKIQLPSKKQIKSINKLIFTFLWHPRKIEQISRSKITKQKDDGGIGIPNLKLRTDAIFVSRMSKIFGFRRDEMKEPWHLDALYQIGTRIIPIMPDLYSNERPNADLPDSQYTAILKIFHTANADGVVWKNIKIKALYNLLNPRISSESIWLKTLLLEPSIKFFFTNREREIAWRTKANAYKWSSWMFSTQSSSLHASFIPGHLTSRAPCFFCCSGEDTIEHVLTMCSVTREIWQSMTAILNSLTTKRFVLDDNMIKFNLISNDEFQEPWLIPLKAINIVKSNILFWRNTLAISQKFLVNRNQWIVSIIEEAHEDLKIFIEKIIDQNNSQQIQKFSLKIQEPPNNG